MSMLVTSCCLWKLACADTVIMFIPAIASLLYNFIYYKIFVSLKSMLYWKYKHLKMDIGHFRFSVQIKV